MGASIEKAMPREWFTLFSRMQLTKSELRTMLKMHRKYQTSSRGSLDIVEWLTLIDLERNHLTERIFMISDRDGDGRLNFYEFVLSVWKFCILGDHSLSKTITVFTPRRTILLFLTHCLVFVRCVYVWHVWPGHGWRCKQRWGARNVQRTVRPAAFWHQDKSFVRK